MESFTKAAHKHLAAEQALPGEPTSGETEEWIDHQAFLMHPRAGAIASRLKISRVVDTEKASRYTKTATEIPRSVHRALSEVDRPPVAL